MNKFLTGSIAAAAIAVAMPALAADMAPRYTKAPAPAPVMVYNWTGCYIGGNVGGAWARIRETSVSVAGFPLVSDFGSNEATGVIGGAQIGCDYQFAGNFVFGVQGMFDSATSAAAMSFRRSRPSSRRRGPRTCSPPPAASATCLRLSFSVTSR